MPSRLPPVPGPLIGPAPLRHARPGPDRHPAGTDVRRPGVLPRSVPGEGVHGGREPLSRPSPREETRRRPSVRSRGPPCPVRGRARRDRLPVAGRTSADAGRRRPWRCWPQQGWPCWRSPSRSTTSRAGCSCSAAPRWSAPAPGRGCCAAAGAGWPGSPSAAPPWRPVVVLGDEGYLRSLLLLGLGALVWHAGARLAFRPRRRPARRGPRPRRPVVVVNPRSGDGQAARVGLAAAARERGIEAIELHPGDDLAAPGPRRGGRRRGRPRMAGGDGSQAVAAAVAAEARPALRLHPVGHPQPLRPRPRRRPGRRGRGAGRLRRRRRAPWWTSPRSTAGSSSTTCRSGCTPRRCSRTGTGRRRCAPCSTRVRRAGPGRRLAGPRLDHPWRTDAARRGGHPGRQRPVPPRRGRRRGHPAGGRPGPARHHGRGPAGAGGRRRRRPWRQW